jgi:hypothetical protein
MGIVVVAACGHSNVIAGRGDHSGPVANQISRQGRQPIDLILSEAICDRYVFALGITVVLEPLSKCAQTLSDGILGSRV